MEISMLEEDQNIEHNVIKDVRNLFRLEILKKETNNTTIIDMGNLFRSKKENKVIKDRIVRDIRSLFEHEKDYYKPVVVGNFWSDSYIEYESKGVRNKTASVEKYL